MVWELTAVSNASPDPPSYCFTSPGTYKIGRKDCSIVISTDKTVSRLHAEIIVQPLPPWISENAATANKTKSEAILRDLSKFGTFVNKAAGSKPVLSLPNREAAMHDGDEITFGTGTSTFRVKYVHLFFCISALRSNDIISKTTSVLGAYCVQNWTPDCTHVLVEEGSAVTDIVLLAVGHKRPVVSLDWFQAIATSSSPIAELPNISSYVPTLKFKLEDRNDAVSVKVVEPNARGLTYQDIIFLTGALSKYHYKELLEMIVSSGGGSMEPISRGKKFQDSKKQHVVIIPQGAIEREMQEELSGLQHLQRIKEGNLIRAVLSGCKDHSAFYVPSSTAQSQSTDNTIDIQDSEDDADSIVNTPQLVPGKPVEVVAQPCRNMSEGRENQKLNVPQLQEVSSSPFMSKTTRTSITGLEEEYSKLDKGVDPSLEDFSDVKYVTGLLVKVSRGGNRSTSRPNFKCFRRVGAISGNSFHALVPFASEPYRETACDGEVEECIRQERKRTAAETLAEELFERDDLKRQRTNAGESMGNILKRSKGRK